jgi:hypothetical protein
LSSQNGSVKNLKILKKQGILTESKNSLQGSMDNKKGTFLHSEQRLAESGPQFEKDHEI